MLSKIIAHPVQSPQSQFDANCVGTGGCAKIRRAKQSTEPIDPVKASGAVIWDFTRAFRLLRGHDDLAGPQPIEKTIKCQPQ